MSHFPQISTIARNLQHLNPFRSPRHSHHPSARYSAINDSDIDLEDESTIRLTKDLRQRNTSEETNRDDCCNGQDQPMMEEKGNRTETLWQKAWKILMVVWNWSMHAMMWVTMIMWALGYMKMEMVMPGGKGMVIPPELEYKTAVTFNIDGAYLAKSANATMTWEGKTYDDKLGFLHLRKPEMFNLKPSDVKDEVKGFHKYGIAMYHQLHCLKLIHQQIYSTSHSTSTTARASENLNLCFDYLRQSIYCSADLTPEHSINTGAGVEHKCRDMREVLEFIGKNNIDAAMSKAGMRVSEGGK